MKISLLVKKQATSFEVTGVTKFRKKCSLMWLHRQLRQTEVSVT